MTILKKIGDGIKGEMIYCVFRRMTKPVLISRTHKHRAQMIRIKGLPAEAYIEKPIRLKKLPDNFR